MTALCTLSLHQPHRRRGWGGATLAQNISALEKIVLYLIIAAGAGIAGLSIVS